MITLFYAHCTTVHQDVSCVPAFAFSPCNFVKWHLLITHHTLQMNLVTLSVFTALWVHCVCFAYVGFNLLILFVAFYCKYEQLHQFQVNLKYDHFTNETESLLIFGVILWSPSHLKSTFEIRISDWIVSLLLLWQFAIFVATVKSVFDFKFGTSWNLSRYIWVDIEAKTFWNIDFQK